jgi:hypothetical protein
MFRSDVVSRQSCSNVRGRCTKMIDVDTRGMIGHRKWRRWEGSLEMRSGRNGGFAIKLFSLIHPRHRFIAGHGLPITPTTDGDAGQEIRTTPINFTRLMLWSMCDAHETRGRTDRRRLGADQGSVGGTLFSKPLVPWYLSLQQNICQKGQTVLLANFLLTGSTIGPFGAGL